jgi:tripartite-type tricarboxylate transporter receptor subunit TctC
MHLSTERYALLNKIKLTHVPFRGTGPMVTDMLGGHIKLGMSSLTSVAPYLANGKLKTYGMASPERAQSAPDVKTFKEQGFGDVDGTIVYTLIAPPNTPAPIVAKLNAALNVSVATPTMREELRQRGFVAMGGTPQELAKWTGEQAPLWGPVMQAAGIKPE